MPKLLSSCPNCPNDKNGVEIYQCEDEECGMIFCGQCVGHHGPIKDGDFYCPFCNSEEIAYIGIIKKSKEE